MATSLFAYPLGIPIFRWYDANGASASAYQVQTWVAGSATPLATYPTYLDALAGTNPNANPVVLDINGAAQIWVQASFYKVAVLLPVASGSGTVYSQDNVAAAMGFPQPYPTEWTPLSVATSAALQFVGATSFQIVGVDLTGILHIGRRIQTVNTAGTVYSTIRATSFAANTLVQVVNDGVSVLDAGLSALSYGIVSFVNDSYLDPRSFFSARLTANQTGFAASTKLAGWTVAVDSLSEWVAGTSRWVCKYPGKYRVTLQAEHANTVASIAHTLQISVSAGVVAQSAGRAYSVATNVTSLMAHYDAVFAINDFVEAFFLGDVNTTVQGTIGTRLSVERIP